MVKSGQIKKSIKGVSYNKRSNMGSLFDESFRIYNLSHPMAGKGEDVPQDDKPEETFELKPTRSGYAVMVHPVQQVAHSGDEQDMSDLM